MTTGYLHSGYAESLAEFGTPCFLPKSEGWILKREVPGLAAQDAMGCYPLFACKDWSALYSDLDMLRDELVSLSLVADPFGGYKLADLHRYFDLVIPFKKHFVLDLRQPLTESVSSHHRYYARKALRDLEVERCLNPSLVLDEWIELFQTLIERHGLKGIKSFSRVSFVKQLSIPGLVMFRALHRGTTVGAHLWYRHADVAYSHLMACSVAGYKCEASYALYWTAFEYFAKEVRWLDLGAGAGVAEQTASGLHLFKRGWSQETRPVYFCGRVFDSERYSKVVEKSGSAHTEYFPAYRNGEFSNQVESVPSQAAG